MGNWITILERYRTLLYKLHFSQLFAVILNLSMTSKDEGFCYSVNGFSNARSIYVQKRNVVRCTPILSRRSTRVTWSFRVYFVFGTKGNGIQFIFLLSWSS